MGMFLGLLAFTSNQDQFASVISHEMTHGNPGHYRALTDDPAVEALLDRIEGYKKLEPEQQEEIRADLGSLDRMIRAGYNPWKALDIEYKFAKLHAKLFESRIIGFIFKLLFRASFGYYEAHPASEIRFTAMELFIEYRGRKKENLSAIEGQSRPFSYPIAQLRFFLLPITYVFTSNFFWWALLASWAQDIVRGIAGLLGGETAKASASFYLAKATEFIAGKLHDYLLLPVWEHVLAPIWERVLGPFCGFIHDLLLHPIWMGVQQVLDILFYPIEAIFSETSRPLFLLGSAAFFISCRLIQKALAWITQLPHYRNLRKVRKDYPAFRRDYALSKRQGGPGLEEMAGFLHRSLNHLGAIARIYQEDEFLASTRWLNGLALARLRWMGLYRDVLSDLLARIGTASPAQQSEILMRILPILNRTPAFVLEDDRSRRLLLQVPGLRRLDAFRQGVLAEETGSPREILLAAEALCETGMRDTARKFLDRRYGQVLSYLTSPACKEPALIKRWAELEKNLRARGTLLRLGVSASLRRDLRLLCAQLGRLTRPLPDRLALLTALRRVPPGLPRPISPRHWLDRFERLRMRWTLKLRFHCASQLRAFAEQELRPRNVFLADLALDFYTVLRKRPRWVQNEADRRALVASDYFWPKYGSNSPGFLESMLIEAVEQFTVEYPEQWKYEPGAAERLHKIYLDSLKREGRLPADLTGRIELWKALTTRGVTSSTDALFESVYEDESLTPGLRQDLEEAALQGRIWDPPRKLKIFLDQLRAEPDYQRLLAEKDPAQRKPLLEGFIAKIQKNYPERGIYCELALETLSREMESTMAESASIYQAQRGRAPGQKAQDLTLRVLSHILDEGLSWNKRQQWRLILFLRGDAPPTRKIRRAFRVVGPERIKRMFEIQPVGARTVLLKTFLSSPRGLVGGEPLDRGDTGVLWPVRAVLRLIRDFLRALTLRRDYSRKILAHVQPQVDSSVRKTTYEILEAFLYALRKATDSSVPQSRVLAYALSMPKGEAASTGKLLKGVFRLFGATGAKIGQNLATAPGILPEEDRRELRDLQENVDDPPRETLYEDLRRVTGGDDPDWELGRPLGSASIKNVPLGKRKDTGGEEVLKMYKQEPKNHTDTEFKILRAMSARLYDNYGAKYGVFCALTKVSERAVKRELDPAHEEKRALAFQSMYAGFGGPGWEVHVPKDKLYHSPHGAAPGLVVGEFAPGVSFWDLPPEIQAFAAEKVFEMEDAIYYRDAPEISLDPDRHPGNYRFEVVRRGSGFHLIIHPIDPGQSLEITRGQREQVHDLFALSQILKETGATRWTLDRLTRILELKDDKSRRFRPRWVLWKLGLAQTKRQKLARALGRYFPKPDMAEAAPYLSLLAALDDAGLEMGDPYFEFVRGLQQFQQYEDAQAVPASVAARSPRRKFKALVTARARAMARELSLSKLERVKLGLWRMTWRATRLLRLDEAWRRLWILSKTPLAKFTLALALISGGGYAAYRACPEPFDQALAWIDHMIDSTREDVRLKKMLARYWDEHDNLLGDPAQIYAQLKGEFLQDPYTRQETTSALLLLAEREPSQRDNILSWLTYMTMLRDLSNREKERIALEIVNYSRRPRVTSFGDLPDNYAETLKRLSLAPLSEEYASWVPRMAALRLGELVDEGLINPDLAQDKLANIFLEWSEDQRLPSHRNASLIKVWLDHWPGHVQLHREANRKRMQELRKMIQPGNFAKLRGDAADGLFHAVQRGDFSPLDLLHLYSEDNFHLNEAPLLDRLLEQLPDLAAKARETGFDPRELIRKLENELQVLDFHLPSDVRVRAAQILAKMAHLGMTDKNDVMHSLQLAARAEAKNALPPYATPNFMAHHERNMEALLQLIDRLSAGEEPAPAQPAAQLDPMAAREQLERFLETLEKDFLHEEQAANIVFALVAMVQSHPDMRDEIIPALGDLTLSSRYGSMASQKFFELYPSNYYPDLDAVPDDLIPRSYVDALVDVLSFAEYEDVIEQAHARLKNLAADGLTSTEIVRDAYEKAAQRPLEMPRLLGESLREWETVEKSYRHAHALRLPRLLDGFKNLASASRLIDNNEALISLSENEVLKPRELAEIYRSVLTDPEVRQKTLWVNRRELPVRPHILLSDLHANARRLSKDDSRALARFLKERILADPDSLLRLQNARLLAKLAYYEKIDSAETIQALKNASEITPERAELLQMAQQLENGDYPWAFTPKPETAIFLSAPK